MPIAELKDCEAAQGYESPTYDTLKRQHQKFVLAWLRTMDYEQAALDAGYTPNTAYNQGFRLARDPEVVKAIEELCDRRLSSVEQSRASITHRLMLEATVSKYDLVEQREFERENASDGKTTHCVERIREYEEIEECWRVCLGMVEYTREGDVRFNTTAQNTARKLLATYMKWDREPAEMGAAVMFDFGDLKPDAVGEEPPKPSDGYQPDTHAEKSSAKNKNGRKTQKELNGSAD